MNEVDVAVLERGERAEIQVWGGLWDAAPPATRAAFALSKESNGDALVLRAGLCPSWGYNRMLGVGVSRPVDLSWMEAQFNRYAASGTPFAVSLYPAARPTGLASWLE